MKTVIARKIIVRKNYPAIFTNKLLEKLYCERGASVFASEPFEKLSLTAFMRSNLELKML
jgi:hypothetical protein